MIIHEARLFKRGATTLAITLPRALCEYLELEGGQRMRLVVDGLGPGTGDRFHFERVKAPGDSAVAPQVLARNAFTD